MPLECVLIAPLV